jgi:hypothetical protein
MKIEIARDARTGFPCLRCAGGSDFTALLPVTKLQAEEWIWREGLADVDAVAPLVERLGVHRAGDRFPAAVHKLERLPIGRLDSQTVLSVLASNLSLWTAPEETWTPRGTFPTPASEWGHLLRWLGGRVPRYDEWLRTQDSFAQVRTEDLLHQVLKLRYAWPPAVERLLWKVRELVPRGARGLPFMGRGLYELIADTEQLERLTGGLRKEVRPQVAGDSPVWPSLDTELSKGWRPLRRSVLPVVTVRPWYSELAVMPPAATGFDALELATQELESRSPLPAGRRTALRRKRLKPYVRSGDQMRQRCPQCHEIVDKATFHSTTFDCVETRVEEEQPDGSRVAAKKRAHKYQASSQGGVTISKAYLDIARAHPERIHTIALAGYTCAGKTTFLLSFGGLMDYPDGDSVIFNAFPQSWSFSKRALAIHDLRGGGSIDRRAATEAMWLDGVLPTRTEDHGKAARDQVLFSSKPVWLRPRREVVAILDDMAGEAISKPKMVTNENYPHFASIADVIYIVPTDNMSYAIMEEFGKRLEQAQAEGVAIDLKKINLVFVISKIDQLKYGSPAERDLFERILPRPYRLPQDGDSAELKAYLAEMEEVHYAIENWLRENKPEFFHFFDRFGSVRCCGLSAFGFQPTKEPEATEFEFSLAFRPEPVRVVDPVFWLLKDNGLIDL